MAPYREIHDVAQAAIRLVRAVGRRVAQDDPDDLAVLVDIGRAVDEALRVAVDGLRESGFTDAQIGRALGGVSRQAVGQRFPRQRISA